jgi:calcium/calmodulin-dependent protein kinase I
MWSVGVILFVLLCGYPPFAHDDQSILFQLIRTGEWQFNHNDWCNVSPDARDLISNLLVVDPARRLTATQALESEWLRKDDANLSLKDLSPTLQTMKERNKTFRSLARNVMLMNKGLSMSRGLGANGDKKDAGDVLNDNDQKPQMIL